MNAVPPIFDRAASRPVPRPAAGGSPASATSMRWHALGDAGAVVAAMAGRAPEPASRQERDFPLLIRDCAPWRRTLAEKAVADLAAVMEPGLAALLSINARGADTRPAARALLHEFNQARAAIIALLPPSGPHGPLRSA